MLTHDRLAKAAREWRGSNPVRVAAAQLGIPKKTWDNIEQGAASRILSSC
jgi:hypothetical protein